MRKWKQRIVDVGPVESSQIEPPQTESTGFLKKQEFDSGQIKGNEMHLRIDLMSVKLELAGWIGSMLSVFGPGSKCSLRAIRLCRLSVSVVVPVILGMCSLSAPQVFALQQDGSDENVVTQNSTKKLRVRPSEMARQIGLSVQWRDNLEQALDESRQTGRPVFWYVATVPRTFMDRKVEIDRYMLAGPFSWPRIVQRLNQHFIPLRQPPTVDQAKQYQLTTYDFVEPGFVVLDSKGKPIQRVDQLTTLHPAWLASLIGRGVPGVPQNKATVVTTALSDSELGLAWQQFVTDPSMPIELPSRFKDADEEIEFRFLQGMQVYYSGNHSEANQLWKAAIGVNPASPLAAKCAAEREGFGPFVRGFEVHDLLSESAFAAGAESRGSAAPVDTYSESEVWENSVQLLLRLQRDDGALVDSDYDFGGTDSLPNVHVAVTALAGQAMLLARGRITKSEVRERLNRGIRQAYEYVIDDRHLNYVDRDEILWACAFRLNFLSHLKSLASDEQAAKELPRVSAETFEKAITSLEKVQSNRGNWYHEYQNSFVTATALSALFEAEQQGGPVDDRKVALGLEALLRDRFNNGAFPYYSVRKALPADAEGNLVEAAGRLPVCELALWQWGRSDADKLSFAIEKSIEHYPKLRIAYKYDNHTSTLSYGGFFFWYDLQNRASAIARVENVEKRKQYATGLREEILRLPEVDGRFVDSHELGRIYGTSMALISLGILENSLTTESSQ